MMTICIAQAADIFGAGLVAGALVVSAFAVLPAAGCLDPSTHVLFRQRLIRKLSTLMPPLMELPVAASIAALALCRASVKWPLEGLGCALSSTTIGITVVVNGRLSRRFALWTPDALPGDWQHYVRLWDLAHYFRTVASVCAFACAVFASA